MSTKPKDHEDTKERLLGEYMLNRSFKRANIDEWTADLRDAGARVHELAHEMEYRVRRYGRAHQATAAEMLESKLINAVNFRLHELRGDEPTYRARYACCGPLWRGMFERWSAPDASVAALDMPSLLNLGTFLQRLSAQMRGWNDRWNDLFSGEKRSGRKSDVAAWRMHNMLGNGERLEMALRVMDSVIKYGLEEPPKLHEAMGADAEERKQIQAEMIVDRWRKSASRARKTPSRPKQNRTK